MEEVPGPGWTDQPPEETEPGINQTVKPNKKRDEKKRAQEEDNPRDHPVERKDRRDRGGLDRWTLPDRDYPRVPIEWIPGPLAPPEPPTGQISADSRRRRWILLISTLPGGGRRTACFIAISHYFLLILKLTNSLLHEDSISKRNKFLIDLPQSGRYVCPFRSGESLLRNF